MFVNGPITIDVVDSYLLAPALPIPTANSINLITFGADPTGAKDATAVFAAALQAAVLNNSVLWIPEGKFTLSRQITLYGARFHHGFCCVKVRVRVIGLRLLYSARLRRKYTLEDAIKFHAFDLLEGAAMRVPIPLG
jgi:hypothetical protein